MFICKIATSVLLVLFFLRLKGLATVIKSTGYESAE